MQFENKKSNRFRLFSFSEWNYSQRVGGNRKRYLQSTNADQKSLESSVFDCRLPPIGRQTAIENSVSNDF